MVIDFNFLFEHGNLERQRATTKGRLCRLKKRGLKQRSTAQYSTAQHSKVDGGSLFRKRRSEERELCNCYDTKKFILFRS